MKELGKKEEKQPKECQHIGGKQLFVALPFLLHFFSLPFSPNNQNLYVARDFRTPNANFPTQQWQPNGFGEHSRPENYLAKLSSILTIILWLKIWE
jgi:hypothetical protein